MEEKKGVTEKEINIKDERKRKVEIEGATAREGNERKK